MLGNPARRRGKSAFPAPGARTVRTAGDSLQELQRTRLSSLFFPTWLFCAPPPYFATLRRPFLVFPRFFAASSPVLLTHPPLDAQRQCAGSRLSDIAVPVSKTSGENAALLRVQDT